jgi:hypothetical protein
MDTIITYPIFTVQSSYLIQIDLSAGWFNDELKWTNSNCIVYYNTSELPKTIGDIITNKYITKWLREIPYKDVNFNIDLVVKNDKNKMKVYNTIKQIEFINSVVW